MKKIIPILAVICIISLEYAGASFAEPAHHLYLPNPDSLKYAPLHFNLPKAQRKVLSNGTPLHIMEDHELPLVKITVLSGAGHAHDPLGKEGLAELTGTVMLTGGTSFMSGNEVDDSLAFMAAEVHCRVNLEYTLFTLSFMKKDLDRALEIFSQILARPAFEQGKLQIAKNLKIEELRRISDNPDELAFRHYRKLIYRGNPRGRLPSFASLNQIDRQDLMAFHERFYSPRNMMMAVSGDITTDEILSKLNQYLGNWKKGNDGGEILLPTVGGQSPTLSLISKDTPQSIIIYGHLGPAVSHPDFYPFTVLDFIVGSGGFRSRMFLEVRTKRGLAYSSGSFYAARKDYGVFQAYAITGAGSTTRVLNIMNDIFKKIREGKVAPDELRWAKTSILNNFIFSFKTADDVAYQQMMLEYQQLPSDFLETYRKKIATVNAEDVKRAASKYLDSRHAVILVLGPEKEFDAPLSVFGTFKREDIF